MEKPVTGTVSKPVKSLPLVSLITCTGSRPEAFQLCQKFMDRQTYKGPIEWSIINDSGVDLPSYPLQSKNITATVHRASRTWKPGLNTQRFNMEEAVKHVTGEVIFFIEDDDWYHPEYLERMLYLLKRYPIVGEGNSKYFNVKQKAWREMRNTRSSSLSQTGIHKSVLPILKAAVDSGEFFFDMYLWRKAFEQKLEFLVFSERQFSVGMKGLPGRLGLGTGHTVDWNDRWIPDPKLGKLKDWIGAEDVELYRKFVVVEKAAAVKPPLATKPAVPRPIAPKPLAAKPVPPRPVAPKLPAPAPKLNQAPQPSNQTAPMGQPDPFRPSLFKENN